MTLARAPAKVSEPQLDGVLLRRALFRRLDAARKRPVVWIHAPAGAGKTTLVASYLRARRLRRVWYRVDARDTDAATFFHYLRVAAAPLFRKGAALPLLPTSGPTDVLAFARRCFEELFVAMRAPSALVFDDYQDAPAGSPLHELVRVAASVLPRGCSLIVLSREGPPQAMAGQLAASGVALLDWDALRLSPQESAAVAVSRGGTRADGTRLHELAGGWAAGLVLLLQRGHADVPLSLIGDGGAQRVFDYFASEIFDASSPETRDFLLRTALLPNFTAAAAEQLTGAASARATAARLHRERFFTDRIEGTPPVYQYHPLFRAFLLDRSRRTLPPEELAARMRAAGALLADHDAEQAFELLTAAGDEAGCASLAHERGQQLLAEGRSALLGRWIAALPAATLARGDGWLLYYQGICRLGAAPAEAVEPLSSAARVFRERGETLGLLLACVGVAQAIIFEGNDFRALDPWIVEAEALFLADRAALPSDALALKISAGILMALANRSPGSAACVRWAERTLDLAERSSAADERALSAGLLLTHYAFLGQLGPASMVLERIRPSARDTAREPLVRLTFMLAETLHAWVRGENAACLRHADATLALAEESGVLAYNPQIASLGVAASLASGELARARPMLRAMGDAATVGGRFARANYHYYAAWDAMLRGDAMLARESLAIAIELGDATGFPFAGALGRIALALALRDQGSSAAVSACLAEAHALVEALGSDLLRYSYLLVAADVALRNGDRAHGFALLAQGLRLGRERDISTMFWLLPGLAERTTLAALDAGLEVDYVRALIRKWRVRPQTPPLQLAAWPWAVELRTLGRFEVRLAGQPLVARGKAQQMPLRLLRALVALGPDEVSAMALTQALWPDSEGDAARRVFDTTLHRLRRLLDADEAITLSDGHVRLDPQLVWVDIAALEDVLRTAERAPTLDLAARIFELYRGALLSEADGAWVLPRRERIRGRVLRALLNIGRHLEEQQLGDAALDLYVRALDVDDGSEPLYRAAMRCCHAHGREAEAHALYERCRRALARLGSAPSSQTEALASRLVPAVTRSPE